MLLSRLNDEQAQSKSANANAHPDLILNNLNKYVFKGLFILSVRYIQAYVLFSCLAFLFPFLPTIIDTSLLTLRFDVHIHLH